MGWVRGSASECFQTGCWRLGWFGDGLWTWDGGLLCSMRVELLESGRHDREAC